ncbi:MAG: hypothetical protein GF347_04725 [Candidatus Moranbacteria bacterium]|nr:hypothetical protein [Candidatus Moranbacteria bacterium]
MNVPKVKFKRLQKKSKINSSGFKLLIEKVREIQKQRFKNSTTFLNSAMTQEEIYQFCTLEKEAKIFLKKAVKAFDFSTRSYFRILKVARTIADFDNQKKINTNHLAEAVQYQEKNF